MKELTEFRLNDTSIINLKDNLVKGPIIPEKSGEINRDIVIQGNTIIDGAVYAHKLEIQNGSVEIKGAVFTQLEFYVNSDAEGVIKFRKSVGSSDSIVARAQKSVLSFMADINAKTVTLYNAFVSGSIYGDEVILKNCVVIGGVFATQNLEITNSIIGTFNAPSVMLAEQAHLLLPSAFSIEKIKSLPGTKLFNLTLADLGSLYRRKPEAEESGKIEINIDTDELRTTLVDQDIQKTLRTYSVIGKVLATELLDVDKFQNNLLLISASLGPQLLKQYDLGVNEKGEYITLDFDSIRSFFFDLLHGKIQVKQMDGTFSLKNISESYGATPI